MNPDMMPGPTPSNISGGTSRTSRSIFVASARSWSRGQSLMSESAHNLMSWKMSLEVSLIEIHPLDTVISTLIYPHAIKFFLHVNVGKTLKSTIQSTEHPLNIAIACNDIHFRHVAPTLWNTSGHPRQNQPTSPPRHHAK